MHGAVIIAVMSAGTRMKTEERFHDVMARILRVRKLILFMITAMWGNGYGGEGSLCVNV